MKNRLIALSFSLILVTFQIFAGEQIYIKNFSQVNSELYRGARPLNIAGLDFLAKLGIKSIVNLQGGDLHSEFGLIVPWAEPGERPSRINAEKNNADSLGMGFINTPLNSIDHVTDQEDKAIDAALLFMNNQNNQQIFHLFALCQ